jgi:hypothetical protein
MNVPLDILQYPVNAVTNIGVMILNSTTDTVPDLDTPYYVKVGIVDENDINSLDYVPVSVGDLYIKCDRDKYLTNFDMSDNGELIVIGEDAGYYTIDNRGHLMYNLPGGYYYEQLGQLGIGNMEITGDDSGFLVL